MKQTKTFYFNLQSKGGAGKSMLTYLQALKNENNEKACFVDLDSFNKSSTKQLQFLQVSKKESDAGKASRFFTVDIYDHLKKMEREKMMDIIQGLAKYEFDDIYMDFGGSESEQFPTLFSLDFTIDEFKDFETFIDAKFVFNIIISGGTLFAPCFEYAANLIKIIGSQFEIVICINEMTFANRQSALLLDELTDFIKKQKNTNISILRFGNFQADRNSGQHITDNVRNGRGIAGLTSFAAKTIMKRELARI